MLGSPNEGGGNLSPPLGESEPMKELLIGCGSRRMKDLFLNNKKDFDNLTTLDCVDTHHPDVVWDLRNHPLPFKDSEFDEIHAYEVLEHLAYQGDYEFFFREFTEYARILKPGGAFLASVPAHDSVWALGDPSHKRVIMPQNLLYLDQDSYSQIGQTNMSDFRGIYKAHFKRLFVNKTEHKLYFALENRK